MLFRSIRKKTGDDFGKRMIFYFKQHDSHKSIHISYHNDAPNSGDPFGYKVPLDCDSWCIEHGYESITIPYGREMDVPLEVARAIWRWLQGEGWERYPQ